MNSIKPKATVCWKSGLRGGTRAISTECKVLKQVKFSLGSLLPDNPDTDSVELIAAAHAASFSLALASELGLAGPAAGSILTTATATLEHLDTGWTITKIDLNVLAKLPRITQDEFIDATVRAKTSCLISRLLRAHLSMNAKLAK